MSTSLIATRRGRVSLTAGADRPDRPRDVDCVRPLHRPGTAFASFLHLGAVVPGELGGDSTRLDQRDSDDRLATSSRNDSPNTPTPCLVRSKTPLPLRGHAPRGAADQHEISDPALLGGRSLKQVREHRIRDEQQPQYFDVNHPLPLHELARSRAGQQDHACVRHDDVKPPEPRDRLPECPSCGRLIGDVRLDHIYLGAIGFQPLRQLGQNRSASARQLRPEGRDLPVRTRPNSPPTVPRSA